MELIHIAVRSGRLSSFLKEEMGMSTGLMNRLKWKEGIFVNGQPRHTDHAVEPGDVITVPLDEKTPEYPAEEGELTVLYEDAHLLAVDKPAGMLIHPSHCQNSGTLANLVAGYYKKTGQSCAFHPMTRLDRDTFGIVLLAKNSHVHRLLQEASVQKTYRALVFGQPQAQGIIDGPIARREKPSLLRYVSPEGKPSLTEYTVLARYAGCALLALRPVTGRTHQLRVHCSYMGHPILGDPQYASEESRAFSAGLRHQLLQACSLEFVHPVTGQALCLRTKTDGPEAFVPGLQKTEKVPEDTKPQALQGPHTNR